jgi:SAM-dependent methyltransferase
MLTAANADPYLLYEKSVQTPDVEVAFLGRVFEKLRGRTPLTLREDFCGSAAFACEWVKSHKQRRATGLDLHKPVLDWCRRHHVPDLGNAQNRLTLLRCDVLKPPRERFDIAIAYNYSFSIFKTRDALRAYFRSVHKGLAPDGLFFLDNFGGSTAQQPSLEERSLRSFKYIWEQERFNPIDNHFVAHIHFKFKDGTMLKKAFTYDWRLWSLVELRELLEEAGFAKSHVYWDDPDGRVTRRTEVENDPAWSCYLIAER